MDINFNTEDLESEPEIKMYKASNLKIKNFRFEITTLLFVTKPRPLIENKKKNTKIG